MSRVETSLEARLAGIQERSGTSLDEAFRILEESSLEEHDALQSLLEDETGMDHRDADILVHVFRQRGEDAPRTLEGELDRIYSGERRELRSIHDVILEKLEQLGDFDVSAKQTYVSLRREKRFATVGPVRETHVEVGLDVEGLAAGDRLRRDGLGGSRYSVRISDPEEVDDELLEWMRRAFESAG